MLRVLILTCCLMAAPAFAEAAVLTIAQDRYEAGASVRFEGPAVQDLFMAGIRVVVAAPVSGSAHLAGRRVAAVIGVAGAGWSGCRRMGSMKRYAADIAPLRAALPAHPASRDLIRFATLAANSHNTQAWQFRVTPGRIDILPDLTRRTPAVDPDDHHLFATLGCAAENLSIAAAARGLPGDVAFDAGDDGAGRFDFTAGASRDAALCDAIPLRQSTRADYDGSQVTAADLATLIGAVTMPGVDLVLMTDRAQINRVRDLVIAGNTAQIADP